MKATWLLAVAAFCVVVTGVSVAQDNRALEQELSNHYVGREFQTRQPYANSQVWFDSDGKITETPRPVCPSLYGRFTVKRIEVHDNLVSVLTERPLPVIGGKSIRTGDYIKDVLLRFQAQQPWTADSFNRAFQTSLRARGWFAPRLSGAVERPSGGDARAVFFVDDGQPVYRVDSGIQPPQPLSHPDPGYTESARRAHVGGEVLLRLIVNEDGSVSHVEAGQPGLGYGLEDSAVQTVSTWRFTPGTLDGKPVKTLLNVETSFCLY